MWELEVALIGDYKLTLPPETEPLDDSGREDHLAWRRRTLSRVRRGRVMAEWRRILTLGLWRAVVWASGLQWESKHPGI